MGIRTRWILPLVATVAAATAAVPAAAGQFGAGLNFGYSAGLGGSVYGTYWNFTRDVPLSLRVAFSYTVRDPGDPLGARHVFINDNTNGTPEESGHTWQARFDLLFPITQLGPQQLYLFGGARHGSFTGTFNFIGGNEKFDVTSKPWGLGLGVETYFAVGTQTDFAIQLGFDYFFKAKLQGHDTAYSPDGDDVNPRNDYTYGDADEVINQPKAELLAMVGFQYRFGR
jgi:hypothetical protein